MPAVRRARLPLLILVGMVFVAGIAFGAVAALTSPRKDVAKATTPDTKTETTPTDTQPSTPEPEAPATTPKTEPTRKAEPKPKPMPTTPKTEPKPEPPKTPPTKPVTPTVQQVSYQTQIAPIFKTKCVVCHGDPQIKSDLDLRTLAAAVMGGKYGPGAVPGKLADSQIWDWVKEDEMPPPGSPQQKLTADEKKLVKDWILSGAK